MNIQRFRQFDFSLGVQAATSWLLRKPNEIERGINLRFTENVGGFRRKDGNVVVGDPFSTVGNPPLGGHIAKYSTGNVRFVAVNNNANTNTIIRTQNTATGVWTTLPTISYPPNSVIFFLDFLDEVYITGFDPVTGDPITPYNVDKTLDVSGTRNILFMPAGYFLVEYLGVLYIGNVKVNGTRYPDRFYRASAPLGPLTYIQGAQTDALLPVILIDQVPTMTGYTTPSGVAAASSEVNAGNQAWQAFDDTNDNRWIAATNTNQWVRYDFGSGNAKTITYYSVVGERPGEVVGRGPKTWTLEGSNDATTWTVLDTQTNAPAWGQSSSEKRTYPMSNTTAYRYYRMNISANQGADYITVEELEFLVSTSGVKAQQIKIDSARYVKSGMTIDIYKAGTEQKNFTLTVATVDKANNIVTYLPYSQTFLAAAVNTTTDVITLPDATQFPTGSTIKFDSSGSVPSPLSPDVIYYSIYLTPTTIKVATTLGNAQIGSGIDLNGTGSGNMRIRTSYVFNDNDELWINGRKGKLTSYWNTDYPNTESTGEWFAIKPGTDSSNTISAMAKSANRLFIFTKNSGTRWDGQNLVVFNGSVGCISHRSIRNIDDDWLIWVDAKGNVWARNEAGSQQENISRPVRNQYLRKLTSAQLKAVAAGLSDNVYKLDLGPMQVPGADTGVMQNIRICYDFDANTWSPERNNRVALMSSSDDASGVLKPYFFADNGSLYIDETGNLDDGKPIAMEMGTGRNMLGTEQIKKFTGLLLFSANCSGLKVEAAVDGGQMHEVGTIDGRVCYIPFPEQGSGVLRRGTTIDYQIMGAMEGDPPQVDGAVVYFSVEEDIPSERRIR